MRVRRAPGAGTSAYSVATGPLASQPLPPFWAVGASARKPERDTAAPTFANALGGVIEALRGYGYTRFFCVERVASSRQGGVFNQLRSNLQALWHGLRMQVVETTHFTPGFYEMIIAVRG